jgi:hypothetical protein
MAGHYFIQGLFFVAGFVSALASVLNWNWFFNARNAQLIVKNVGRNRARLFYGILGVILMGMAVFFYLETTLINSPF